MEVETRGLSMRGAGASNQITSGDDGGAGSAVNSKAVAAERQQQAEMAAAGIDRFRFIDGWVWMFRVLFALSLPC
jgi:hypothetical protein